MKAAVAGQNAADLIPLLHDVGIEIDRDHPDVVITYGGDGTLLGAERDWPGVAKLAIRHPSSCVKCANHEDAMVIRKLAAGEVGQTVLIKIEANARGQRLLAMNDVTLNRAVPTSGVRYRVWINGEAYSNEIVADGLAVATPFGSSAYHRSITGSFFRCGIGVAFNNTTQQVDHLVLRETERLRLLITRGPAVLCADNCPQQIQLEQGDEVGIGKAPEWAVLLAPDTLFCNKCRRPDGSPFNRLGGLTSL